MPRSAAKARAWYSASTASRPTKRRSAPARRIASAFGLAVPSGTNTMPRIPSRCIAYATAAPWLPLEAATQPARRSASSSVSSRLKAPRSLNEPVCCRFSSLRCTSAPVTSEKYGEESSGVRLIHGPMRAAAAAIMPGSAVRSIGAGRAAAPVVIGNRPSELELPRGIALRRLEEAGIEALRFGGAQHGLARHGAGFVELAREHGIPVQLPHVLPDLVLPAREVQPRAVGEGVRDAVEESGHLEHGDAGAAPVRQVVPGRDAQLAHLHVRAPHLVVPAAEAADGVLAA